MAQYAILIYEDEASSANAGQEAFDQTLKEHTAFGEQYAAVLRGGRLVAADRHGHLRPQRPLR
jgi:hypothetical protein